MPDQSLAVDGQRVLSNLTALRAIGAYKTGVHKPTFSEPHLQSLKWLADAMHEAGLTASIDGIGNVIGSSAKPGAKLLAGSHLESRIMPDGSMVHWASSMHSKPRVSSIPRLTPDPSRLPRGGDEEGHFGNFLGSRSYVNALTEADIDAARDRTTGQSMRDALQKAGFAGRPRLAVEAGRHVGYLEAHIEQGERLESSGNKIGVVTSIVGIWQYKITFAGEQNHAGTTRMAIRKDAGLALAKFCVAIEERFPKVCGARTVWTTGRIALDPGAPSIIPGSAEMLFQIRDDDVTVIDRLEALLLAMAAEFTTNGPCAVAVEKLRVGKPALMDKTFQAAISAATGDWASGRSESMPSGAGHDAQILATVMPAGMLFVPSIGGISHHWTENTSDADIVTGARVFVAACAKLLGQKH